MNSLRINSVTFPGITWAELSAFAFLILVVSSVMADEQQVSSQPSNQPGERKFQLTYAANIIGLKRDDEVRIWIPEPPSTPFQQVKILESKFPCKAKKNRDRKYGNSMFYLQPDKIAKGTVSFQIDYQVNRKEAGVSGDIDQRDRERLNLFLQPNKLVPVDGKPVETFDRFLQAGAIRLSDRSMDRGRVFYDFVEEHMKYDKSKPGYGKGDSNWACDSRTGNCTDFHSLFISIARANRVPAQFRIGFPLPEKRGEGSIGGYHCWALFHSAGQGWVPVDISEADKDPSKKDYYFGRLTENRVHLTTGRDIVLQPRQAGPPLNYFVFPHVEVNGKVWPKDKVQLDIRYQDQK